MNDMKRHWGDQDTSEEVKKKHRSDLSTSKHSFETKPTISCIEQLPNEVFYEIFDYLEGRNLHDAFTNLNSRFQNLLNFSSFRTKIVNNLFLCEEQNQRGNIEIPYKHRTVSLEIFYGWNHESTPKICAPPIDASFVRLQCLKIHSIGSDELFLMVQELINLPKLTSLSILDFHMSNNVMDLYCQLFALPALENVEIGNDSFDNEEIIDVTLLSMAYPQSKTIKYLDAIHQCSLPELYALIACTPSLHRLSCSEIADIFPLNISRIYEKNLNLTSISIQEWSISFNGLEVLLKQITPHLKILRVNNFRYPDCLNAERWQRIISESLPNLSVLKFGHEEIIDEDFSITLHHSWLPHFNSTFWSKRNWFLRVSIDSEIFAGVKACYSIETCDHLSTEVIPSQDRLIEPFPKILSDIHQLDINDLPMYDDEFLYIELIGPLFLSLSITCLNISYRGIFPGALIDLLQYLPQLQSLVIDSLTMVHSKHLSIEESRTLHLLSKSKSIEKLKFERISHLGEIQFVLDLCPHIRYLEIDEMSRMNLESFIRFILMKNGKFIPQLSYICCGVLSDDKNISKDLQTIIQREGLCEDYFIVQYLNKIYLRWNTT